MFYALRKKFRTQRFNLLTNDVRNKVLVTLNPSSKFCIVSQLQEIDINMYLLALASFCRFSKPSKIVLVSDGISSKGIEILVQCVPGIEIIPIETARNNKLPSGGTWERLTTIINQVTENYIIQLDADTLTLNEPTDVLDCIESNRAFSLVANSNCEILTLVEVEQLVKDWTQTHVQVEAEKAMGHFKDAASRRYLRGCSAFTGFPKQAAKIETLISYSDEMISSIGEKKWSEWGSEQVASNYMIASIQGSYLLPFEYYPFYDGGSFDKFESVRLCHFIGSHRFDNDVYLKFAKQLIKQLR